MAKATITNKEIIFALRFICFILSVPLPRTAYGF